MSIAPVFYAVAPLAALVARGVARATRVVAGVMVEVPTTAFGCAMAGETLAVDGAVRFEVDDAVVHGPEGVVSIGREVVAETLLHVWPQRAGAWRDGALWRQDAVFVQGELPAAEHLLSGDCGNYYHWLLDGVSRWVMDPDGVAPCLVPWTGHPFQRTGPPLWSGLGSRCVLVRPGEAVAVRRLGWTHSMTAAGAAFHPLLRGLRLGGAEGLPIYVSRGGAANRPLRNEAAVEALCMARGFRVVRLAELAMAEQAALFAGARRVVAPHGAGLANLVFAAPGSAVLELQMDAYANPCFRRLAATMGVRDGCVVGRAEPGDGWVHARAWSVDVGQVVAALDDPSFQETT